MKVELENFIIEYDKEISYLNDLINTLLNNTRGILDFFELDKISNKKKVDEEIGCDIAEKAINYFSNKLS